MPNSLAGANSRSLAQARFTLKFQVKKDVEEREVWRPRGELIGTSMQYR